MAKYACNLTANTASTSRPDQFLGEILGGPIKAIYKMSIDRVEFLREKAEGLKFTWVIAEGLEKLGFSQGTKINEYLKRQRYYREKLHRESEDVIRGFTALYRKNKKAAEKTGEILLLSSGAEINPFMPKNRYEKKTETVEIDGKKMTQADAWELLNDEVQKLKSMEPSAIPVAKSVFDSFQSMRRKYLRALIQAYKDRSGEGNLKDDEVSAELYERIKRLKEDAKNADNDAYVTFLRSGNYIVNVFDEVPDLETGDVDYVIRESKSFESKAESQEYAEEQRKLSDNPDLVKDFKKTDIEKYMYGMGNRGAINSFFDKLKPELEALKPVSDPSDKVAYDAEVARIEAFKTTVHNMSLLLYPESSVKRQLTAKRKGTEGYMTDVLKVYAIMSDRYASQISQLQYNGAIDSQITSLNQQLKNDTSTNKLKGEDKYKAVNYTNELAARVLSIQSEPSAGSRFANAANQIGFLWFLGLNPSSAFVNFLQVPGVTLPWLSARFEGQVDNINELRKAYATIGKLKGKYFTDGTLSERIDELTGLNAKELKDKYDLTLDEVGMLKELDKVDALRSGMQIYDINSIADMGGAYPGSFAHVRYIFNKISGYLFQKAELVNREVTALAAYRLARRKVMIGKQNTMTHEEAIKFADQAVEKTQGAYAEDQAPRIMTNPAARVILMFKKFPMHMATIYIQMFKDVLDNLSGPNANPATRRIAIRQFTMLMGASGIMSGVAGMPLYYLIRDTMNLAFDSEDEPYNFDMKLRDALIEQFGDKAGNMMFRGVLNDLLGGVDIGSRVSYESSFLLGGTEELPFLGGVLGIRDVREGEKAEDTLKNVLTQLAGPGYGIVAGPFRAFDYFKEGDVLKGIEAASPSFLRNMVRSGRFATEGVLTARGDPIIEDISTREVILQAMGFTPNRLSSQYKINSQLKDIEQEILERRRSLLNQYYKAIREKDSDKRREVMAEIREFNKSNPGRGFPITSDTISRSIKKRDSLSEETEKGIFITKSVRPYLRQYEDVEDE